MTGYSAKQHSCTWQDTEFSNTAVSDRMHGSAAQLYATGYKIQQPCFTWHDTRFSKTHLQRQDMTGYRVQQHSSTWLNTGFSILAVHNRIHGSAAQVYRTGYKEQKQDVHNRIQSTAAQLSRKGFRYSFTWQKQGPAAQLYLTRNRIQTHSCTWQGAGFSSKTAVHDSTVYRVQQYMAGYRYSSTAVYVRIHGSTSSTAVHDRRPTIHP